MNNPYRNFSPERRRRYWTSVACGMTCGSIAFIASVLSHHDSLATVAVTAAIFVPVALMLCLLVALLSSGLYRTTNTSVIHKPTESENEHDRP